MCTRNILKLIRNHFNHYLLPTNRIEQEHDLEICPQFSGSQSTSMNLAIRVQKENIDNALIGKTKYVL